MEIKSRTKFKSHNSKMEKILCFLYNNFIFLILWFLKRQSAKFQLTPDANMTMSDSQWYPCRN